MTQSDKQNVIAELEEMLRLAKIKHEQIQHEAAHHWTIAIYLEKEINARKETLKKEKEKEAYAIKKVAVEERVEEAPTAWVKEENPDESASQEEGGLKSYPKKKVY